MAAINNDDFLKAVQSETIVLVVGKQKEQVTIARDLLSMQSPYLAKHVSKCNDYVDMETDNPVVVKMFVRWCYRGRLETPSNPTDQSELKKLKNALLRLWIFGAIYDIGKLQNNCMEALISLNTPDLVNKNDVKFIWTRAPSTVTELRTLIAYVLVAQIEEGENGGEYALEIEEVDEFGKSEGFVTEMYSALKQWLQFQPPKSPKKEKRTKWSFFVQQDEVREFLMVDEKQGRALNRAEEQSERVGLNGQVETIEID